MAGFRGVFTIPVTPFDERGEVDEASLQREVDWCVRAGAHGIVAPVNASEGPALTDEERKRVTRLVAEALRAFAREGIDHLQMRLYPNNPAGIEAFAPVIERLGRG